MQPRYAQEDHTHVGLTGGAGEGWSGVYTGSHAYAGGGMAGYGTNVTSSGLSTSIDTTLTLSGTHMQARTRFVRRYAANWAGYASAASTAFINSVRGFHARWVFGTVAYNNNNPIFVGLYNTLPAAAFTSFTGWASLYAMGVYKNPSADTIDWVWRTDASTTGSASTGLSWRGGYVYQLELDCDPVSSTVAATLSCSYGEEATYTFSTFPDANSNPAALMGYIAALGGTGTTTQLALHDLAVVEPW